MGSIKRKFVDTIPAPPPSLVAATGVTNEGGAIDEEEPLPLTQQAVDDAEEEYTPLSPKEDPPTIPEV